jgi:hypothetical protein
LQSASATKSPAVNSGDADGQSVLNCAQDVLVAGTSLYESSVSGGSLQDLPHSANSHARVADWSAALDSLVGGDQTSNFSVETSRDSSVFSNVEILTPDTSTMSTVTEARPPDSPPLPAEAASSEAAESDYDTETELDTDMARAAIREGSNSLAESRWEEAESILKESLHYLQRLPARYRTKYDLFDLRYKLAVCTFYTHECDVARETLTAFVEQRPSTDERRLRVCHVAHLLAHLYIRAEQLEPARAMCENALKVRGRLTRKSHPDYYQSLALMSHIDDLMGLHSRAKIRLSLIPEASRETYISKERTLTLNLFMMPGLNIWRELLRDLKREYISTDIEAFNIAKGSSPPQFVVNDETLVGVGVAECERSTAISAFKVPPHIFSTMWKASYMCQASRDPGFISLFEYVMVMQMLRRHKTSASSTFVLSPLPNEIANQLFPILVILIRAYRSSDFDQVWTNSQQQIDDIWRQR